MYELLHSFGLVDRYLTLTLVEPSGKRTTTSMALRNTGGRRDPLGGEEGKVLIEDLDLLFQKHGVYEAEESRGLAILRRLEETEGLSLAHATGELYRQEKIIRTGKDPRSLIKIREEFRDKLLESVDEL